MDGGVGTLSWAGDKPAEAAEHGGSTIMAAAAPAPAFSNIRRAGTAALAATLRFISAVLYVCNRGD